MSIIDCDVIYLIDLYGSTDAVFVTNISVSSNAISLINSHVPIVPVLFINTLTRVTSPDIGSKLSISTSAYDSAARP